MRQFYRITTDPAVALSYDHIHKFSRRWIKRHTAIFAEYTIEYHQTQRMKKMT